MDWGTVEDTEKITPVRCMEGQSVRRPLNEPFNDFISCCTSFTEWDKSTASRINSMNSYSPMNEIRSSDNDPVLIRRLSLQMRTHFWPAMYIMISPRCVHYPLLGNIPLRLGLIRNSQQKQSTINEPMNVFDGNLCSRIRDVVELFSRVVTSWGQKKRINHI